MWGHYANDLRGLSQIAGSGYNNVECLEQSYLELEVALVRFVLSYIYYNNYYVFVLFSPDGMYMWVW